uniref:Uncharacterized protein n=1 Tax=Romanomermis culicivorax TaxID=13658 RepID=A0A915K7H3_ROMCU
MEPMVTPTKPDRHVTTPNIKGNMFSDTQTTCALVPLAFHMIRPHSQKELDFVMTRMFSYRFITLFSPEAQAKIKEMAWQSGESPGAVFIKEAKV